MARARRGSKEQGKTGAPGPTRRKIGRDGVSVEAINATRGRTATTVHVELDPARVAGAEDPREVEEVVAEFPREERASNQPSERSVRWEDQPLQKTGDAEHEGKRTVRYSATRYEGSDAGRYGIKVRVRTKTSEVDAGEPRAVREADKPDG